MGKSGCTCESPHLVAAKDENLDLPFVSGNPFSRFCTNCGRRYFCAKAFWENATEQFVIPRGNSFPVSLSEREGDEDDADDDEPELEDGGDDEPVEQEESDGEDDADENEFECPGCGEHLTGYPDECPECGAEYNW